SAPPRGWGLLLRAETPMLSSCYTGRARAIGRRRSPPPLWVRIKEGGRARPRKLFIDALRGERSATPHPCPPPQGGRECAQPSESSLRPIALGPHPHTGEGVPPSSAARMAESAFPFSSCLLTQPLAPASSARST